MSMLSRSPDPQADRRAAYAVGYAEGGDHAAAADLMRQALDLAPEWAGGWNTLAGYLEKAGEADAAAEALRRTAALDPDDALGARARLAALGHGDVPQTLPPSFVRGLFDQYADRFERQLRDKLAYRAPELLLAAIQAAGNGRGFEAVLDLGCGTGLMGEALRPLAAELTGLDLSSRMLAKARGKGVYDALHEADILGFDASAGRFDLVVAADVFNYLGALGPVLRRVRPWLRPGGHLAFTVEAHEGPEPYVLRETLRYAHGRAAVEAALAATGFRQLSAETATLREDRGVPVKGLVIVASA